MRVDPMRSTCPTNYGGGTPEEWLNWKNKLLKAVDNQNMSMVPQRPDMNANFNPKYWYTYC